MNNRKFLNLVITLLVGASLLLGITGRVTAAPTDPKDETKVPHYFGPYPNYANSPFTLPDAIVTIDGDGTGAEATATVGAGGAITAITITNPGHGYTAATVTITDAAGTNTSASADAVVSTTGAVTAVTVDPLNPGHGYTKPKVTISGGGATTDATATAFGGVDAVTLGGDLTGYTMPTVDFDLPDGPNGVHARGFVVCVGGTDLDPQCSPTPPATVTIDHVVVTEPGSGYSSAPGVAILDGTRYDPIRPGASGATAVATLSIQSVTVDTFGAGYTSAPTVVIDDDVAPPTDFAVATATVDAGAVIDIINLVGGSDYVTGGGIRKFIDPLPGMCDPDTVRAAAPPCPTDGSKYIPLAVPDPNWTDGTHTYPDADTYVIGLVQYRMSFSSDLPDTLVRGYVQLETPGLVASGVSQSFPLVNEMLDGSTQAVMLNGSQVLAVTPPQYLGPIIAATRDRAVRIVFHNFLPTGAGGNLFLPVDTTIMGSGRAPNFMDTELDNGTVLDGARNPLCGEFDPADPNWTKPSGCFTENRATLHLHGGITPWISDGTPHQWITPAGEDTLWPEGVSVENVPDMNVCQANDDGCQTFYYTNQQSARFMFYHDHAWGITRLNVYAGEAAGYLISDDTEKSLLDRGLIPADQIPLVIQDKTFVPDAPQLAAQDPTWDTSRWGGYGNMWVPHVYMPAQNPGDPSGMSAFGRWMYGPWFWPPATPAHGPIANPYYDPNCDPNTADFCEPELIPGTPNITVGMEAFNDTPIVNGTAYPDLILPEAKAYRLRILNAANDRFWNLQWYVADATGTEVALKAAEVAAAQTDPVVFPTPDLALSPAGPDWIQIGTEGGFLPAPVVVDGQQVTTWIMDPTRFDVGNVDQHSLLLAPAERADVIVDFSQFAGQTLILYNDAPAAFPARVPGYDYYTGGPDLYPAGAPTTLPGYGPNTRTIMRVHVGAAAPANWNGLAALQAAFRHNVNGTGVFESGQNPIIVGQAAYNSAYGTRFVSNGWCNAPNTNSTRCDGFARIQEQGGFMFGFNTLKAAWAPGVGKMQIPLQPKGMHDEMNATAFDEYGRMEANLGLEAPGATPLLQNIILYPYVNPQTEIIDASNLPVDLGPGIQVDPISSAADGTQIWKITHNGVDTHPIHWHLYDVQVLNRVTWDNIIIPPDATELGWKDTLRISPLEDTIVALRPIIPTFPFEVPNSVRPLNPSMPPDVTIGFNNTDAFGNPTDPIVNRLVNFGWEYVFHCHILSHEEKDMMRPVSVGFAPNKPDTLAVVSVTGNGNNRTLTLSWNDNSINETSFLIQRTTDGTTWTDVATIPSPLDQVNTTGTRMGADTAYNPNNTYLYRVVALNDVGYGGQFMHLPLTSTSDPLGVFPPNAPTNLTATYQFPAAQAGPQVSLTWRDNATNESGFVIERAVDGGAFTRIATAPARNGTGNVTFVDTGVQLGHTYSYRVAAVNLAGLSAYSNTAATAIALLTPDPAIISATAARQGNSNERVTLVWTNVAYETGYVVQWSATADFATVSGSSTRAANSTTYTTGNIARAPWYFRIRAFNATGSSAWVTVFVPAAP
jgi:FtsP/CotA-like multicopper oxidase with cupredoxin domain